MKSILVVVIACLVCGFSGKKMAGDFRIENPRVMVPVAGTKTTAGYLDIVNPTKKDITIKVKSVEGFEFIELHETYEEDGMMSMRMLDELVVKAESKSSLKPGGLHLMFMKAKKEFKEKDKLKVVLTKDGVDLEIELPFMNRKM